MKICALHYLNQSIEELQLRKERLEGVIRKIATAQPKTIIDHDRELYGVFIMSLKMRFCVILVCLVSRFHLFGMMESTYMRHVGWIHGCMLMQVGNFLCGHDVQ